MARSRRVLGKRGARYGGGYRRPAKRRRTRSGNVRTGGLYRLRGQRRRLPLRQQELKFKDKYLASSATAPGDQLDSNAASYIRLGNIIPNGVGAGMQTGRFYVAESLLTGMECGTNAYQRIGRKIMLKSILVDVLFTGNVQATEKDGIACKMWLILDKQCNGTAASATDIFGIPQGAQAELSSSVAQNIIICNQPYIANRQRFSIMKEWSWICQPQVGDYNSNNFSKPTKHIQYYKRLNLPIEYGGTTGAIGEIKSNNVLVVIACTKTNGATHEDYLLCNGIVRIRFADS